MQNYQGSIKFTCLKSTAAIKHRKAQVSGEVTCDTSSIFITQFPKHDEAVRLVYYTIYQSDQQDCTARIYIQQMISRGEILSLLHLLALSRQNISSALQSVNIETSLCTVSEKAHPYVSQPRDLLWCVFVCSK